MRLDHSLKDIKFGKIKLRQYVRLLKSPKFDVTNINP